MKIDFAIGGTSAFLATAIPDAVIAAYSGKATFAIVMAIVTTLVSFYLRRWLEKRASK